MYVQATVLSGRRVFLACHERSCLEPGLVLCPFCSSDCAVLVRYCMDVTMVRVYLCRLVVQFGRVRILKVSPSRFFFFLVPDDQDGVVDVSLSHR